MSDTSPKTSQEQKDPPKQGEEPPPGKAEAKRREQSGKTFQKHGTEVHK